MRQMPHDTARMVKASTTTVHRMMLKLAEYVAEKPSATLIIASILLASAAC